MMIKDYIIGIVSSLSTVVILKILEYFWMKIQDKINIAIRGLQFSLIFISLIYAYLIFTSTGIHKFVLGLFLFITIIILVYFTSKTIKESANKLPKITWLKAKDGIKEFNISYFQLKQHILCGLPIYSFDDPIQFIPDSIKPMSEDDISFTLSYDDERLENDMKDLLFKRQDIEKYLKK